MATELLLAPSRVGGGHRAPWHFLPSLLSLPAAPALQDGAQPYCEIKMRE